MHGMHSSLEECDACHSGALLGDRPAIRVLGFVEDGPTMGRSCHKSQSYLLQVCNLTDCRPLVQLPAPAQLVDACKGQSCSCIIAKSLCALPYSNKPADIQAATSRQSFSEELTSWLLAEMKENRNSKTVKAKVGLHTATGWCHFGMGCACTGAECFAESGS